MPYAKAPDGHTEFGGGPGLVDPQVRADRALEGHEELWEVYATNPAATGGDPAFNPETAPLERERNPGAVE